MAHRIGLNDTVYEPDIHSQVDFSFFDDSDSEERTKGTKSKVLCDSSSVETNGFAECVVNSATDSSGSSNNALSSQTQLILGSSQPHLEDTSCAGQGGTLEQSGWCIGASEGHQEDPQRPPPGQDEGNVSGIPRGCGSGAEASVAHAGATAGAVAEHRQLGSAHSSKEGQASPAAQTESAGAAANTDMERADLNPYSSDEWEDSEISDSTSDHSDSSDDDDPKSQVDRLIERGTRLYMEGTDSNVSSDSDSDDDDDFSDSESDITDVSPLVSGACSPLRLSPTMSRRSTTCKSPLAVHDNKNLGFDWSTRQESSPKYLEDNHHSSDQGYESTHPSHINNSSYPHHHLHHDNLSHEDPADMTLLLQAVIELEKTQHKSHNNHRHYSRNGELPHQNNHHISSPQPLSTIHVSPHTRHLSTPRRTHRKNMSFSNEEVRRIDRENQILLQKIMTAHTASKRNTVGAAPPHNVHHRGGPVQHKPSNSLVMRRREEEKIRRENMILLRKIQEAKPSRDVAATTTTTRSPRYHHHHHRPSSNHYHHHHHHHHIGSAGSSSTISNSLTTAAASAGTGGSCGASARSAGSHHGVGVATPTSRKETAL